MKRKIYICYTNYQLLVTLLKIDNMHINDICLLFRIRKERLKKIKLITGVNNIFFIEEYKFSIFSINNIINNYKFLNKYSDIFIFSDHRIIGHFLNRFKIKYRLLEDGYNFFKYGFNKQDMYNSKFKNTFYNLIMNSPKRPGDSKYAVSIEVNDKSIISSKDSRYKKMIELSRKYLFSNISESKKIAILDIFNVKPINYVKGKKTILILTQPLYQDNFDKEIINSEEDQIKYYKSIVDKYKEDCIVYFKVHPRDTTDYYIFYDSVIFLDENVPMELYEFIGNYIFDVGITHSSTALDYLSCVKEKIFLKDLRK